MERVLGLPVPQLLLEFPGCGAVPLLIQHNTATRSGGGLYKGSCNSALHCLQECLIENVEGSMVVLFVSNSAGAAGGAAFVQCHTIGDCSSSASLSSAHSLDSIFSFQGNSAGTFGPDLASGPQELVLEQ